MNNLDNHIVLVTGAGSGIGSAIAKRLARDGARIFLNDIDPEKLNKINTEILNLGCAENKVGSMVGDVSSPTDMKLIFQACLKKFDDLSMLVNNAGILQQTLFTDISVDDWDRMVNVHLKGCFLGCHFAVPLFKKRGGGINTKLRSMRLRLVPLIQSWCWVYPRTGEMLRLSNFHWVILVSLMMWPLQ